MPAFIHNIATEVPAYSVAQTEVREQMKSWAADEKTRRLIHAVYSRSGIETRHSVCPDFKANRQARLYQSGAGGSLTPPGTAARNRIYALESRALAVQAARKLLESGEHGFTKAEVTHVVFASCTGFVNPGPDFHLVRDLGLNHETQRYTLGFMGCYAAFPALRMAEQFCQADASAVVLVVCLELCTLHLQMTGKPDDILAHSLFADGAAAALVSARQPAGAAWRLDAFASALLPAAETEMAWEVGDRGFNIVLSSYVPEVIGTNIAALLGDVAGRNGRSLASICHWAVHPGGRAILDKVQSGLGLEDAALACSRAVLNEYGNMSSATVLFVLKRMLEQQATGPACAVAFGPGLTVETALLERV